MRPLSLVTLLLLDVTLASTRANSSANNQFAVQHSATTNISSHSANASIPAGPFSYIIPFSQSQQCDIFGPMCQTGLITVGVSLASSTRTTTLPCSSYLTAQATHLLSANLESGGRITLEDARQWLTAFGRSPECKSYAEIQRNEEKYTFSVCGSQNTIIQASDQFSLPAQVPPGVFDQFRPLDYACCGNCTLIIPEVRLLYFPDQAAPQCENRTSNSSTVVSARAINKRVQSLNNTGSIAVYSGHTFTSPSVYVEVVGTAAIKDECGSFGPMLKNPIITLPPNVLSTYVPPSYSIGSTYTDPNAYNGPDKFVGRAEPLKVADLQCPTFGLGVETSADGSLHTTVGPPWLPIIIPPREVFTLDPTWESICTDLASYYVFESFAIFDPPFALTPQSNLVAPSPAASSRKLEGPPDIPANPTAAYDPPATYLPDLSDPSNPPAESVAPLVGNSPSPQESPVNAAQPAAVPHDPAAKPTTTPDLPDKSTSEPQEGESTQSSGSSGLGSFVLNALGKSDPPNIASGNANPTHIIPVPASGIEEVTVGAQILSISPSGVYLSGTSYSAEGPAITLPGGVFSLVSTSPVREATPPDDHSPMNDQPFTPSVQTIAGHNVVSNKSGVYVAGSSLSPGGSAITASNTIISLSPAGTLVIGSSSKALPLADTHAKGPTEFNVDGMTIQAEPSAVIIDGITVTPGGPGTEISGNSVSLEQSGTLVVGTSRLALPTAPDPAPTALNLDGMSIQLESSAVLIDGTTVLPGGLGISIHGTRVSLEQDGILDIGTSHFTLPPTAQEASSPSNTLSLEGMAVRLDSSAVLIDGTTLIPGGPGAYIHGTRISLEQNGVLDIGTSHFALPQPATAAAAAQVTSPPNNGFILDGMTVQSVSSAILIDGTTLIPGGPGISIHGIRASLHQDGTLLDIGTGHFALPPAATAASVAQGTAPHNAVIVDGMTVRPQPSTGAVVVNGITLTPGRPGTIINGTSVSLEPDGTLLDIGGGRFAIPTQSVVSVNETSAFSEAFEGGKERGCRVPVLMTCFAAAVTMVVGIV